MRTLLQAARGMLLSAVLVLTATLSLADVVVLENGDHLTGRILKVTDGVLELETTYAGVIKVQALAVKELSSATEQELHLDDGEVIKGRVNMAADRRLRVEASDNRSAIVIPWDRVSSINLPPPEEVRWQGAITLGGTMKRGNSDSRDTSVAIRGARKTERDRISMKLRYNYGEEDGRRTAEDTYGALKYDYFMSEKVYTFLSLEFLVDPFKDLNLRTVVGPGVGYQFFDEKEKAFSLEAGLSYFNEDRDTADDESWLTGRLGANLRYQLLKWLTFGDELLLYPSLEEGGEYQLRNEAALTSALGASWSFNLTNIYEHDSQPPAGVKSDDLTWVVGLQYAF